MSKFSFVRISGNKCLPFSTRVRSHHAAIVRFHVHSLRLSIHLPPFNKELPYRLCLCILYVEWNLLGSIFSLTKILITVDGFSLYFSGCSEFP